LKEAAPHLSAERLLKRFKRDPGQRVLARGLRLALAPAD
jgi:hypothetical protein